MMSHRERLPHITHWWLHKIIKTWWKSEKGSVPCNLLLQQGRAGGKAKDWREAGMLGHAAFCCGCQIKDPCEEKTINNLGSIKFKAAANSGGLYIVNYMNFPITMSHQRPIIAHSSNYVSTYLVLSINATVAGLWQIWHADFNCFKDLWSETMVSE